MEHGDASTHSFLPKSYRPLSPSNTGTCCTSLAPTRSHTTDAPSISSLAQVAMGSQCLDNFWNSFLPNGLSFSAQAARYSTAGWTEVVLELDRQDSPVRLALSANALASLGEQSGQRSVTVEGWRVYGKCLQLLAQSLPAKTGQESDELLATSMLLAEYEVCHDGFFVQVRMIELTKWSSH